MQSKLTVFPESSSSPEQDFLDFDSMRTQLEKVGIRYERWTAEKVLGDASTQEEVIIAYKASIERLMKERGYVTVDVVSLNPESTGHGDARKKFLDEHTHGEDEVRFFVDGSGMFYIHANSKVYMMLCTRGDLISLPAGTKHWFDMGPKPFFKAIRLFNNPDGWVAKFTGDSIASQFPKYE